MTDDVNKTSVVARTEGYLKAILSFGGIVYAIGFLVVSVHLSRYDIFPFGVIRIQYILAGMWLMLPLVLMLCIAFWAAGFVHDVFFNKSCEQPRSRWRFVWVPTKIISVIFMVFSLCALFLILLSSSMPALADKFHPVSFAAFLKVGGFCLGISLFGAGTWAFLSDIRTKTAEISFNDLFWGGGSAAITAFVFAAYLGFFAVNIYPSIPADLGGGSPIEMRVILKKSNQSAHINKLLGITDDTVFSPSLKLLLATEKS